MKKILMLTMVIGLLVSTKISNGEIKLVPSYIIGISQTVTVGQTMIYRKILDDGQSVGISKVLTYLGKNGSIIRLKTESRFSKSEEITYDLKDGNVISYGKLKIKVLKVDNMGIEFIVISD